MKPIYNLITLLMDWLSVEVGADEEWFNRKNSYVGKLHANILCVRYNSIRG